MFIRRQNEWIGLIIRHEGLLKLLIMKVNVDGKNHVKMPRLEHKIKNTYHEGSKV